MGYKRYMLQLPLFPLEPTCNLQTSIKHHHNFQDMWVFYVAYGGRTILPPSLRSLQELAVHYLCVFKCSQQLPSPKMLWCMADELHVDQGKWLAPRGKQGGAERSIQIASTFVSCWKDKWFVLTRQCVRVVSLLAVMCLLKCQFDYSKWHLSYNSSFRGRREKVSKHTHNGHPGTG